MTCHYIETKAECEAAADELALNDISAEDGTNSGTPEGDPPYCYYEGNSLKINEGGTNTGACGNAHDGQQQYLDICICFTEGESLQKLRLIIVIIKSIYQNSANQCIDCMHIIF